MAAVGDRIEAVVDRVNGYVIARPVVVVVTFFALTAVLAGGLPLLEVEEDMTAGFTEGLPEEQVFEDVQEQFGGPFDPGDEPTTLVHVGDNVLTQQELVHSLNVIERAERRGDLRIIDATGPAPMIAQTIDPTADTSSAQRWAIEHATPTEIRIAVRELADDPQFRGFLADDFNPTAASAGGSITILIHDFPAQEAHGQPSREVRQGQLAVQAIAADEPADIQAMGWGLMVEEFDAVIEDSLLLVLPVVLLLILGFLGIAYRDPIDIMLALIGLGMVNVWTFGFLGYAGIPFTLVMIAIPVLMLAIGIDLGIHVINRYREELDKGTSSTPAMRTATGQLTIAFLIVTVTATIGFGANIVSDFPAVRDFGIVASIGMVFTAIVFAFFLPAAKLATVRFRRRFKVPRFSTAPIATEDSTLGRVLASATTVTRRAPVVFVVLFLVVGLGAGVYATGVDSEFEHTDFLPPDEFPDYITDLPDPFAPSEYPATRSIALLEERFEKGGWEQVILYVEGPFQADHALYELDRLHTDPPSTFVEIDGRASAESIITVIHRRTAEDPEFAALVNRNDLTGDGLPDRNLDRVYDELATSSESAHLDEFLTDDRRAAKIVYTIEPGAAESEVTEDAYELADRSRFAATPTGDAVIGGATSVLIVDSAIRSLSVALVLTAIFLMVVYNVLVGRPMLGLINLFPILLSVAMLVATMRYLGISLDAMTGMLLPISIGVGIDYSVHIMHRFIDEFEETNSVFDAIHIAVTGTGGAAAGSMLTTATGVGALIFALSTVLSYFGLLMALSVVYAFLSTIIVLPPSLYLWVKYVHK